MPSVTFPVKIIPAIRDTSHLPLASAAPSPTVFLLESTLSDLPAVARELHRAGKTVYAHVDLIKGLAVDREAIRYISALGTVKGVLTTRTSMIRFVHEYGLRAVLRVFMLDSHALTTAEAQLKQVKPDVVEVLPAYHPRWVLQRMYRQWEVPFVTGGLLRDENDIRYCLSNGAAAVSVGNADLWSLRLHSAGP